MRWTVAANVSGSDAPAAPRPTPMRIFIRSGQATMRGVRPGLIGVLVSRAHRAVRRCRPATPRRGDTWYRAALVRRAVEPPYRTQLDDSIYARSDCGPAVLGMALAAYGIDADTLDLRQLTHTYQGTWPAVRVGTALQHMAHVAEDFGLASYGLYSDRAARPFTSGPSTRCRAGQRRPAGDSAGSLRAAAGPRRHRRALGPLHPAVRRPG